MGVENMTLEVIYMINNLSIYIKITSKYLNLSCYLRKLRLRVSQINIQCAVKVMMVDKVI